MRLEWINHNCARTPRNFAPTKFGDTDCHRGFCLLGDGEVGPGWLRETLGCRRPHPTPHNLCACSFRYGNKRSKVGKAGAGQGDASERDAPSYTVGPAVQGLEAPTGWEGYGTHSSQPTPALRCLIAVRSAGATWRLLRRWRPRERHKERHKACTGPAMRSTVYPPHTQARHVVTVPPADVGATRLGHQRHRPGAKTAPQRLSCKLHTSSTEKWQARRVGQDGRGAWRSTASSLPGRTWRAHAPPRHTGARMSACAQGWRRCCRATVQHNGRFSRAPRPEEGLRPDAKDTHRTPRWARVAKPGKAEIGVPQGLCLRAREAPSPPQPAPRARWGPAHLACAQLSF